MTTSLRRFPSDHSATLPRWDQASTDYDPDLLPSVLGLPILNAATLALHVLQRDFTWLRPQRILLAKGPFAVRDGDEIDFEREALIYRQNQPKLTSVPHPFALLQKMIHSILSNSPVPSSPSEAPESVEAVPVSHSLVLQGCPKSGRSAWAHFCTRFLLTKTSFENEPLDIPFLPLLALLQALTAQPGLRHDYESQVGMLLGFEFGTSEKAQGGFVQLVGMLSTAHFAPERPSFALLRTLSELKQNPLKLPVEQNQFWYHRRRDANAEIFDMRHGVLFALSQIDLEGAGVTAPVLLEVLSCVEHIRNIKVRYQQFDRTRTSGGKAGAKNKHENVEDVDESDAKFVEASHCRISGDIYEVADKPREERC